MVRKIIFGVGLLLYIASLCLPSWNCVSSSTFRGVDVLLSGWMAVLWLEPRWFCNLVILLAAWTIFERPVPVFKKICFVLAAIGSTTIFGPYLCGDGPGSFGPSGTSMALGGYLWIASLWIVSFSTLDKSDWADFRQKNS
jgi:hypothetical protein